MMIKSRIERFVIWKEECFPPWWPHTWCLTNPPAGGLVTGLLIGAGLTAWAASEPDPWMSFGWLNVTYEKTAALVHVDGEYEVIRGCHPSAPLRGLWRLEALGDDGRVIVYGPVRTAPPLTTGEHIYKDYIPVDKPVERPEQWQITIIVTCPGALPETVVSPPERVEVMSEYRLGNNRGAAAPAPAFNRTEVRMARRSDRSVVV